jgi:hypothetical protein
MTAHNDKIKVLADFRRLMREKSAEGIPPDKVACKNCRYSVKQRSDPNSVVQSLVCRHSPPAMTMLPTAQGLVINVQFPIVRPEFWCFQFDLPPEEPKESA